MANFGTLTRWILVGSIAHLPAVERRVALTTYVCGACDILHSCLNGKTKTSESGHSKLPYTMYMPHSPNYIVQESCQFQLIPHFIYTLLSEQI